MNMVAIRESEFITRIIAKWSSVAAAAIFGLTFVTDKQLSWNMVSGQAAHIAAVAAIFVGYAVAWIRRYEVLGSVIALSAMLGAFVYGQVVTSGHAPTVVFLAVGTPALFHLVAVVLHRLVVSARAKARPQV